jgi:hypothetical protein
MPSVGAAPACPAVKPNPPTTATDGSRRASTSGDSASPVGQAEPSARTITSPAARLSPMLSAAPIAKRRDVRSTSGALSPIGAVSGLSRINSASCSALGSFATTTTCVRAGEWSRSPVSSREMAAGASDATTTTVNVAPAGSASKDGTAAAVPYRTSPSTSTLAGAAGVTLVLEPRSTTFQPARSISSLRASARVQSCLVRASMRSRTRWVISAGGPAGVMGSLTREGYPDWVE